MRLDLDFIILGSIVILLLVPLYIYRKKVFKFIYDKGDFNAFIKNLDYYLKNNYPKIKFDLKNIIEKTKDEKNIRAREILVIEDIVSQFSSYEYELKTQNNINKESLWSTYEQNSKSLKDKYPSDFARRKEFTWIRDKNRCNRCGLKTKLIDAKISFVKPISEGGGFNFENLVTHCNDCYKILNSTDLARTSKSLLIQDELINTLVD